MPDTLDVIKINGRWAQVIGGLFHDCGIKYLKDGSMENVDLNDYKFSPLKETLVEDLLESPNGEFGDEEFENVYFDADTAKDYNAKMEVTVFGEFLKE